MDQQLYWPAISSLRNLWVGLVCIVIGIVLSALCLPLALIPVGVVLTVQGFRQKQRNDQALQQRRITMDATHSVLMSHVEYVGGHPLVPIAGGAVLGLSPWALTIYSVDREDAVAPLAEIPLESIVRAGMGRPKSAREVYDEDYGYTIDVYEHSAFLSVIFELDGKTYRASFEAFEPPHTPQDWYNQIAALGYQLDSHSSVPPGPACQRAVDLQVHRQPVGLQTHTLAIVGLVSGIVGLTMCPGLGPIVAVVASHRALRDIRAEPTRYTGAGLAKGGLITGWLGLGVAALGVGYLVFGLLMAAISSILQYLDSTLGISLMSTLCDVFS